MTSFVGTSHHSGLVPLQNLKTENKNLGKQVVHTHLIWLNGNWDSLKLNSFLSGNRLPTTHQLHAATPPLLDLLAVLHWMQSGVNWSSNALTCTDCTITQGQSAMLCFAACGKLSNQAHTCTDCKTAHVHVGHGKLLWQQWPSNLPHRGGLSNLPHRGGLCRAGLTITCGGGGLVGIGGVVEVHGVVGWSEP